MVRAAVIGALVTWVMIAVVVLLPWWVSSALAATALGALVGVMIWVVWNNGPLITRLPWER